MRWPETVISSLKTQYKGVKYIVGIDEVGRGAIAGPMTLGFSRINIADISLIERIINLNDSKKLTHKKRQILLNTILNSDCYDSIELWSKDVIASEIDKRGIRNAYTKVLKNLINHDTERTLFVADYGIPKPDFVQYWENFKKGDESIPVIAIASVFAKETRDNYMKTTLHKKFPNYGFDQHMGYGTMAHKEAIKTFGYCKFHRASWNVKI